jgi:mannose-6-phosphate isomerase-like protein (cupin superfamily)
MRAEPLTGDAFGLSGNDFVLVQWTAAVSDQWIAPLHVHHEDDEAWYVLRGRLGFRVGEETFEVGPGSAVLAPRGTPHTWWNAGAEEAEYLLVMHPRIASLIEAVHEPGADVPALFEAHGCEILEWQTS